MISHFEFSGLRLSKFCSADPLYTDDADEHGDLLVESIRGIDFQSHARVKSGNLIIYLDLLDHSTDAGPSILRHIGLPLTRKSTCPEVVALLGQPASTKLDPDRGYDYFRSDTYEFVVTDPNGYNITCTWLHPGSVGRHPPLRVKELSLWAVRIERSDLSSFPWSED